ncbi:MAG: hypothetical protein Q8L90_19420 [Bacteroidota bacterium]|nr:hypothetical protein [Bacteroidota bacterium]
MNDKFETIKESYSKIERRFPFSDQDTGGTQIPDDDGKVEFPEKVKGESEEKFFLFNNIEKQTHRNAHEYNIVHYLIFYLILFVFIGISTIIIMGVT